MDLWIFAYGSLMWRPNFEFGERAPALLEGAHRALCIYSAVHRGTSSAPGLVLGLDKGGHCQGIVYRVGSAQAHDTRLYLNRRENINNAYANLMRPVKVLDGSSRVVSALCYFANRSHLQYAGALTLERQAYLVRRSVGASGANIDYVVNTVEHLRALNVYDLRLEQLVLRLGQNRTWRK